MNQKCRLNITVVSLKVLRNKEEPPTHLQFSVSEPLNQDTSEPGVIRSLCRCDGVGSRA